MKLKSFGLPLACLVIAFSDTALVSRPALGDQLGSAEFRSQFLQLCDLASAQIQAGGRKDAFFIDSYAVRALCVAYEMTGKQQYLDACRAWSERMLVHQTNMAPRGAYYMNYGRKPGEGEGAWYVADSSSIAMGVLATAVRCKRADKQRFLNSAKQFAALVMDNYVGSAGGIRNGLWPKYDGEWWCSSGIFASLAFLLYDETGSERYLKTALGAVDWLNSLDPEKDQPYPLSEMGPALPMYVLEGYSAGISHLKPGSNRRQAALARISWYLDWAGKQQSQPSRERQWPADVKWGMKFGGLPFHQYVQSRALPDGPKLCAAGDREMAQLASLVFSHKVELTQLPVFMMMSYAERLSPGTIYKSSRARRGR
jgi:hypothetical protein